jgi:hypothetical protein
MASQPAKASNASRYFFLFLIGLVMGAVLTVMALRAIQARQDPFPDSVMHVMDKQASMLKQNGEQSRCAVTDTLPRLQSLRAISNDLELAFPDQAQDQRFVGHASRLRATLNAAIAAPPADCAAQGILTQKIGEDCKACHQDFRG